MFKLSRFLMIIGIIGLVIVALGIYQVWDTTRRYDELAAIPVQALVETAQQNQSNAMTLATIEIGKHTAEIARQQATSLIGVGAVLLGIAAFGYTRLPDAPAKQNITQNSL